MKLISYLGVIAFFFLLMYGIGYFIDREKPATLTHEAVDPDILLSNSKAYIEEHARERSLFHLDQAIQSIKEIEQDMDEESKKRVDESIRELEIVFNEIRDDNFEMKDLNNACIKALNALTYAEIKVSEHFIESDQLDKAKLAMKYGMLHVKNALMFSEGTKKEYEVTIYAEMDSSIENKHMSKKEIIALMERMLVELDSLDKEF